MTQKKSHDIDCVSAHLTSREAAEDAIRLSKEKGIGWDAVTEGASGCGCADDPDDDSENILNPEKTNPEND